MKAHDGNLCTRTSPHNRIYEHGPHHSLVGDRPHLGLDLNFTCTHKVTPFSEFLRGAASVELLGFDKRTELMRAPGVAQLTQRLGFDLADALARDGE